MKKISSISIFFPTLNDANVLPDLISKAFTAARLVTHNVEVIIVNDGSTDDTKNVVKKLQKRFPALRVITHTTNQGYGAALISGFNASKKDWVFYTDGDGQYDPMELTKLVKKAKPNIDVVNGYKTKRADSWIRTVTGNLYNWFAHRIYPLPIADLDCDFRLIRRSKLQKIHLTSSSGAICLELVTKLQKAGARFTEVPVSHYPRRFGNSEFFRFHHLKKTLLSLLHS